MSSKDGEKKKAPKKENKEMDEEDMAWKQKKRLEAHLALANANAQDQENWDQPSNNWGFESGKGPFLLNAGGVKKPGKK